MSENVTYDHNFLTFDVPTIELMRRHNIGVMQIWNDVVSNFSEDMYGNRRFVSFGKLFKITRNFYGGPHVNMVEG